MLHRLILYCLILITCGCVEPFDAPIGNADVGFLVVDGYVNTTTHSVTVKLSRATTLSSTTPPPEENGATVLLTEENGETFPLESLGHGQYHTASNEFVNGKKYQLIITTAGGKRYQSDFITTKSSPPIDSLTWDAEEEGINIRVNTHDELIGAHYYRWDFVETWEYNSQFFSSLVVRNGVVVPRPSNELLYICYKSENSSQIVTGTTFSLSENRISNHEVAFIPKYSQKYSRHYSILVKQYALSKEGHDYWEQLKSSSENLGGLFDPQPSRVKGNISSVNDDEIVIGFFDGGSVSEKRIYFRLKDVPDSFKRFPRHGCEEFEVSLSAAGSLPSYYLITNAKVENGFVVGFYYTVEACADCRIQGGTTTIPDFWP